MSPNVRIPHSERAAEAAILNQEQTYWVHRYRALLDFPPSPGTAAPWGVTRFESSGDYIQVIEVNAPVALYIRIGNARNPWVRMRQGDIFRRDFTVFWVAVFDGNLGGAAGTDVAEALLYTSRGPLILQQPTDYGLDSGFMSALVAYGVIPVWQDLFAGLGPPFPTLGKRGGTLIVRNMGPTPMQLTTARRFLPLAPSFNPYELAAPPDPSSVLTLHLRGVISDTQSTIIIGGVGGAGGTCRFIASSLEADTTPPDASPHIDLIP